MRSLFEVYESITDSDEQVLQRTEDALIYKLIENLKHCNNLPEFIKLWTKLCPKLSNTEWNYKMGGGYALYRNIKDNNRTIRVEVIACNNYLDIQTHTLQPSMTIFGDQGWSNKNECDRFVKNVVKSLKVDYEKTDNDWYRIKF